jgi:hypothetical protein
MRTRRKLLIAGCLVVAIPILGVLGYQGYVRWEEKRHIEAMDHWPELVKNKFDAPKDEVLTTFMRCFKVGDPATKYTHLLATAEREQYQLIDGKVNVTYRWRWEFFDPKEGERNFGYLEVHVVENRIVWVFNNAAWY